jgi:hypothetical protein
MKNVEEVKKWQKEDYENYLKEQAGSPTKVEEDFKKKYGHYPRYDEEEDVGYLGIGTIGREELNLYFESSDERFDSETGEPL